MTPEGEILAHTKRECKRLGLRYIRLHFGPGTEAGWMDVIVLGPEGESGMSLWLETKSPGKPLRPIQEHRRKELLSRGGLWGKPDTKDDVTELLETFRRKCDEKTNQQLD